jgi:hypothetical protein
MEATQGNREKLRRRIVARRLRAFHAALIGQFDGDLKTAYLRLLEQGTRDH